MKDRVDLSHCSDDAPPEPTEIDVTKFLPTIDEIRTVLDRFKIFIMR